LPLGWIIAKRVYWLPKRSTMQGLQNPFQVGQANLPLTATIQNFSEFVFRVYKWVTKRISKLQTERYARNGVRNERGCTTLRIRSPCWFEHQQ